MNTISIPTAFQERFGLRYPIVQAPTGSIAGPELCAAVSACGGMGSLALTWTAPNIAAKAVQQVRSVTTSPFLVNFVLHFAPVSLPSALEAGAPIVSFSWGDPAPHSALVRSFGAFWGEQVTTADGARRAVDQGADFLICQGLEAGGHVQSSTPLWELLPRVLAVAGPVPVLAAGGIADGAGIKQALGLGASAAVLGTRFVATQESRAHASYKEQLVQAEPGKTALTVCFEGGWSYAAQRVLRNSTLNAWEASGSPPVGSRPGEGEMTALAANGEAILRYEDTAPRVGMTGDIEAMCLYAGTGSDRIRDVPTVAELLPRLWAECESAQAATVA